MKENALSRMTEGAAPVVRQVSALSGGGDILNGRPAKAVEKMIQEGRGGRGW